ncbi:hypothetical protein N1031_01950 [Herbiconiux moechotypicola]|uniref:Uncharacterized protein n=1 Tax=Herbiconiux moechotypicola TaxID=637393 RepID=A0ABN3D7L9_9MICO|nr:hypothetical protein [Herbiconiux moechotypicola]MCS5728515.1 hypothetical protein [Herbiconiux moechotypicola]
MREPTELPGRHDRAPGRAALDSRFDAAFQPGFDERPEYDELSDALGFGSPDQARPFSDEDGDGMAVRTRATAGPVRLVDGFVIALWVISALLLGTGISLVAASSELSMFSELTQNFVMLMMLALSAPFLIALGAATAIGTVFLLATRWERRS